MRRGGDLDWRPIFEAFESRDDERIAAVCDRRVRWHTMWPGMDPVYRGRKGVQRWREAIDEALSGLALHAEDALVVGRDRVVLTYLVTAHGRGSGVAAHMRIHDVWTLRKGRLLHRTTHTTRDEALLAAGATTQAATPAPAPAPVAPPRYPRPAAA